MEDLFKFIPIALWILYKIFGSSKAKEQKPKRRTNPQPKPAQSTPSLEDILKELSGESSKEQRPIPAPVAKATKMERQSLAEERKRESINLVDHQYDFRPEYEHHADTGESLQTIRKEIEEVKGITLEEEVDNFDLRKAIIAQTILTRPEY
ncbi:hypothetical protein OAD66_05040 [Bacteroidia bacterium]|nr:hypothetical protein [Bacteroidia bacterium]MDB4107023.1 hypothetical protein [Bacteroidia bacterium]MDB9882482.1 hypothetical protein [Bacteroidia bacterium]